MIKFFMLTHLISIAQAPALYTEILAICPSKINFKEFPELSKSLWL